MKKTYSFIAVLFVAATSLAQNNSSGAHDSLNVHGNARVNGYLITKHVKSPDGVVHIGDSSMTFSTATGTNPISGTSSNCEQMNISGITGGIGISPATSVNAAVAYGQNSIALGFAAKAYGNYSYAISTSGFTEADGLGSIAMGWCLKSTASRAITMGTGINSTTFMTNSIVNSFALGFNSDVPTFFVSGAGGTSGSLGNVGVGTTSPLARLSINGDAVFTTGTVTPTSAAYIKGNNAVSSASTPDYTWYSNLTTGIFHPAANVIAFTNNGTETMRIHSNGYVGIGNNSPAYPLDVTGNAHVTGNLVASGLTATTSSVSVTTAAIFSSTIKNTSFAGTGSRLLLTNEVGAITPLTAGTSSQVLYGNGTWAALPASTFTANGSNAYFTGGNLGIGTRLPAYPLDVTGNANVTGAITSSSLTVSSLSSTGGSFVFADAGGNLKTTPAIPIGTLITLCAPNTPWMIGGNDLGTVGNAVMGTCSNNDLVLEAYSRNSMWIKPNGFVGINSSTPGALLDIKALGSYPNFNVSNSSGTSLFAITSDGKVGVGNDAPAAMVDITTSGTTAGFNIVNSTTSTNLFSVNSTGDMNVNGKITAPNLSAGSVGTGYFGLLVDASGNVVKASASVTSSTTSWNFGGNGSNAGAVSSSIGTTDANNLPFVTDNIERMRILSNGGIALMGIPAVPTDTLFNQLLLRGTDNNHGLGYFNTYTDAATTHVNGPVLYGFENGALATTYGPNNIALKWNHFGDVIIPHLPSAAAPTGKLHTVLVDSTGKLVPGAVIPNTTSTAWNVGGNKGLGTTGMIGTSDNADLIFVAGTDPILSGLGKERMRISSTGDINFNGNALYFNNSASDVYQKLSVQSTYDLVNINGPVLQGYTGGALGTTKNGSFSAGKIALSWDENACVHVGNIKPTASQYSAAKLTVNGTFVAKEIFVVSQSVGVWADYVFKADYKLMPLSEVEKYINANQHLPNVPSTKEVEDKGQNIGELQVKQMEKIEEMYLYMIDVNKKVQKLEEENKELKKEINILQHNK